jgi:hypothetical protein
MEMLAVDHTVSESQMDKMWRNLSLKQDNIKDRRLLRVLVACNRVTYSYNATKMYNSSKILDDGTIIRAMLGGMKNYKDYQILHHLDRVVIQVESLHRLVNRLGEPLSTEPYDIVIIDESESVINQLFSKTLGSKQPGCVKAFQWAIRTANIAIFADAFISQRTVNLVNNLRNPELVTYIRNNRKNTQREAIDVDIWDNLVSKSIELRLENIYIV